MRRSVCSDDLWAGVVLSRRSVLAICADRRSADRSLFVVKGGSWARRSRPGVAGVACWSGLGVTGPKSRWFRVQPATLD